MTLDLALPLIDPKHANNLPLLAISGSVSDRSIATLPCRLVCDATCSPNGLAFSTDWQTMWVADSSLRNPTWTGYAVNQEDQSLGKAHTVLCQATLGTSLGVNPDRPKLGDEGLAE